MARALLIVSAAFFGISGGAMLIAPDIMLDIAGVAPEPSAAFLLRTEGVALMTIAALIVVVLDTPWRVRRLTLAALVGYYWISSFVDLVARNEGLAGPMSVPSAAIRIALGVACLWAAWPSNEPGRRR